MEFVNVYAARTPNKSLEIDCTSWPDFSGFSRPSCVLPRPSVFCAAPCSGSIQSFCEKEEGGLRARRHCAEQEKPGSQTGTHQWRKGVAAMAKNVFNKMKVFRPVALAMFGWLAFVLGQIVQPISLRLMLLSAARVLSEVLRPMAPNAAPRPAR